MSTIVGVFAHPDDEAFGPGGTLAFLSKDNDVYLICATSGESADGNVDEKLGEIRRKELEQSCKTLGVKKIFFLEFIDGTLSNSIYHEVANRIENILKELNPETLITFEPHGVSGHIDHMAISMITSFVAPKIKSVKEIWYYCISDKLHSLRKKFGYFIYFPRGYSENEIDKKISVKEVWDTKIKAMKKHKSQIADVKRIMIFQKITPKEEYFLVKKIKDL